MGLPSHPCLSIHQPVPPLPHPPLRSKDNSLSEEIDRVASAVSRCNENVQLKRDLVAKNERAMQNIDYEVRGPGRGSRCECVQPRVSW